MTETDPIVQAVAEAMCPTHREDVPPCCYCAHKAEAVVAVARPLIDREAKAAALSLSLPRGLTWPTEQVREAVAKALTMTVEDLHVVIVGRDGAATAATSMGIDAEGFTDAVLAALAPHVAALVRAERAAALEDAAAWLHDLPWKPGPGQANRGPTDDPEEWMRGASDGVEWAVDRLTERADRIEREGQP